MAQRKNLILSLSKDATPFVQAWWGYALLRGRRRGALGLFPGLDLGRLLFGEADEMVDDVLALEPVMRRAGDVHLMRAVAAAREAHVRLPCLPRPVHHAP